MRLEQSQAEAKRHFENYVKVRDQLNQVMIHQDQKKENTPGSAISPKSSAFTTPKETGSAKTSKFKSELRQRVNLANIQE